MYNYTRKHEAREYGFSVLYNKNQGAAKLPVKPHG